MGVVPTPGLRGVNGAMRRSVDFSAGTQPCRFVLRCASTAWIGSRWKGSASLVASGGAPWGGRDRTEMQTRAPTETPPETGGASLPSGWIDMRRLKAPETFPFPRFMKATSVAMCTAAGGCGGGREPGARRSCNLREERRRDMEDRAGVCPHCGGWLLVDPQYPDHVRCDTCGCEEGE